MALLVVDCPRCGANSHTFDVTDSVLTGSSYNWQRVYELFAVCRNCKRPTIFIVTQRNIQDDDFLRKNRPQAINDSLNPHFNVERHLSLRDERTSPPPEHLPDEIGLAFNEAATCVAVKCWTAAGAMFRKCVDLATAPLLPPDGEPNAKIRRDLGLRLPWLFDNGFLPKDLRTLSACIHQDGNDAAHAQFLAEEDAGDLLDFTFALLERLYTEPERLRLAEERRAKRRQPQT